MEVNETNFSILQSASRLTGTDYEIIWKDAENIEGYITEDSLVSMLEDLVGEIERLEEEKEDLERDMRDNYKPISASEMYDIDDRYFS